MYRPSDRDINWMCPVLGRSPPVQVKEPYGSLDKVILQPSQYTADNTRKRVWQYIEKERPLRPFELYILLPAYLCLSQAHNCCACTWDTIQH